MINKHACEEMKKLQDTTDSLREILSKNNHPDFGNAFGSTFYNYGGSDVFWTSNDEYASPINFCPGCGIELKTLLYTTV